ncbi:DUF4255 domain-containing protein [Candidatus Manganitrophus noduliformans]|uniref:DUF4255 domain-containing protein n=1 Tax=Candidatus Manganitrophus noduliformans TaxID=2606439 RepID=A0A7X6DLS7_9BACT|nr:DUF4255 domain-containing protein [Candidatus Manganitrophus noduliformans]NKE69582.1 DUF4255 domain-containing protein [Candidatus Manganitrophus noduliformans]
MSTTIGKVTESLKNLLVGEMVPATNVSLISPGDTSGQNKRINLFLYRVIENPHLNNRDWQPKRGTTNQLVAPPLALNLFYLMTPFSPLDPQTGLADAHGLLGEAMRVLYENAIIPQTYLETGLQEGEVKVTLLPLDLEQLSKIWTALNKDFRLSVAYEVSYVEVPAEQERPLPKRVTQVELDVRAPFKQPVLQGMSPLSGPVGTTLQFTGTFLRGWKATVRVGGRIAVEDQMLFEDQLFVAPVPAGLTPGVYEVEVNVANLSRLREVFEVVP